MRSLRMLGLALMLTLLSTALAATAQAKVFNAEIGPVAIQGTGEGTTTLKIESTTLTCNSSSYTGEVSSAVEALAVAPSLNGCTLLGFAAVTVNFEGCTFQFHAAGNTADVLCPIGKSIKALGSVFGSTCEVRISAQEGLKSMSYETQAGPPKTVKATATINGFAYSKTVDTGLCPLSGTGNGTSSSLETVALVKGSIGGKQISVFTDAAGVFNAEVEPAISIVGEQAEPFIFTIENGMGLECSATYSGEVNKAVEQLEVLPSYSGCNIFGASATVNMEGCKYRFNANTTDVDLVCPSGKVVKVVIGTCEVQFGSQEGLNAVSYVNNAGPPKTVTVKATVTGVKYNKTKDGKLCPLAGTGEKSDGEFSGDTVVKGFQSAKQLGVFVG